MSDAQRGEEEAVSWFWRIMAAVWSCGVIADIVIGDDCLPDGAMMHLCFIAAYVCDIKKGLGV